MTAPITPAWSNSIWNRLARLFAEFNARVNAATTATSSTSTGPVISGLSAPTVLQTGQTGTWTINASDSSGGTLSYSVDWGDNSVRPFARALAPQFVQSSTFTHAYARPGDYRISFTVENGAGVQAVTTTTVRVVGKSVVIGTPVISNAQATSTKPRQAVITWDTDVRGNTQIWFGKTSPVDTTAAPNVFRPARVFNHRVQLTRLTPNTTYFVVVGSANANGLTKSAEMTFTTPSPQDKAAPVITSLTGSSTVQVGQTETVTVNAFDPQNGALSYSVDWGDSGVIGTIMSALTQPVFVQSSTFTHVYNTPGTYTANFTVENSAGKKATASLTITVTPAPADTTSPAISGVSATPGISTSTIAWTTDEQANSKVYYSIVNPVDINSSTTPFVSDSALATAHSLALTGLTPNTKYFFVVESADSAGNKATSSQSSFITLASSTADVTAPVISGVLATPGASTSTISWTTNEAATSRVFYSLTTPVDTTASTTASVSDNALTTSHSLELTDLATSTVYHFVIRSADSAGNVGSSFESSFTTTSGM